MTVDKLKLDAIKNAYENERIKYNDIPEKYKEFIDKVEEALNKE